MSPLRDDPDFQALATKVATMSEMNLSLALEMERNTKSTEKIQEDVKEVVAAFKSAKGAFETLEWVGKVSKILLPIILAVAGFGMVVGNWWNSIKKLAS